jgi:exopolysaccharide biosynthesis protein
MEAYMKFIILTLVSLYVFPTLSSEFGIKCSEFSSGRDLTSSITDVSVEKTFGNCADKIVISDRYIGNLTQYLLKSNKKLCIYKRSSGMVYKCEVE